MKIVYTAGVFDLLHRGHINILWESKRLGDVLVVGVVSDAGCMAYKGFPPVQNSQLRMRTVASLGFVDVVELQPTTDPTPLLERYRPDVMTHGDDWSELREGMETVRRLGVEWVTVPYTPGVSSTLLRAEERAYEERRAMGSPTGRALAATQEIRREQRVRNVRADAAAVRALGGA